MLLRLLLVLLPLVAFARDKVEKEKWYIEPTQIGFSNKEIFVKIHGQWISVPAIHADDIGLYIHPYIRPVYPWRCPLCKEFIPNTEEFCTTEDCEGKRPPRYSIPKPPGPALPTIPQIGADQE